MKQNKYDKPKVEVLEVETKNVIATSFGTGELKETSTDGAAYSKKRGFWGDQE